MHNPSIERDRRLRILHVIRAPVGGLFRHVLDLSREQIRRGHQVGLVADSTTGGANAARILEELRPGLALGVLRIPMHRNPHISDMAALLRIMAFARQVRPDVIHGHGSKGAVYARLPGYLPGRSADAVRVYTPHGGSLNYAPGTFLHSVYMGVERILARKSDLILFESGFIAERYKSAVGTPPGLYRIALNGIEQAEFAPITPNPDAADFLYVGELRAAKGIDVLLDALVGASRATGRELRAVLVGSGPDRVELEQKAKKLGLTDRIVFAGPLPARQAFAMGKLLVVPSRAESLPYIVLEAAGAQVPLIATDVGGIPEIFGPYRDRLVKSGDVAALQAKMVEHLRMTAAEQGEAASQLAKFVRSEFCIKHMVDAVLSGYREALVARARPRPTISRTSLLPQRHGS